MSLSDTHKRFVVRMIPIVPGITEMVQPDAGNVPSSGKAKSTNSGTP